MKKMRIIADRVVKVGGFAEPQREFLEFHRAGVFLKREANACNRFAIGLAAITGAH
jgi:hypothetical protein